jgi:hypothetical protein
VALTGRGEIGVLICALAEWHNPGLHSPHRPGHPGGHPLDADIQAAVTNRQVGLQTVAQCGNTASQARSRLCRRVRALLGAAGQEAHQEMSLGRI